MQGEKIQGKKIQGEKVEDCLWKVVKRQGFHFKRIALWIFWWERFSTNIHGSIIFLTTANNVMVIEPPVEDDFVFYS